MNTSSQDCSEYNPQVYGGSPEGTRNGTENRTKTCNVQQLNQEDSPSCHGNEVNSVVNSNSGCGAIIWLENFFYECTVYEVSNDQDCNANQEGNHKPFSFNTRCWNFIIVFFCCQIYFLYFLKIMLIIFEKIMLFTIFFTRFLQSGSHSVCILVP